MKAAKPGLDRFLAAALVVQASLLCFNLNLLDLWGDEVMTLETALRPAGEIPGIVAGDIHPPLYFWLQHFWLMLPLGMTQTAQMRLLSVLFALGATAVVDLLWVRRFSGNARRCFLLLWVLSPCLLLYSRMARSYSLQMLVIAAAAYWTWRLLAAKRPPIRMVLLYAAGVTLALYTHYVPGIALMAAGSIGLLRNARWRDLSISGSAIFVGYLPWLLVMAESLGRWARTGTSYRLTGNLALELVLKAAYGAISFTLGETMPDWMMIAGLAILPAVALVAMAGAKRSPDVAWLVLAIALAGFLGVARWASYPFIPARLLFLFPFYLLFLVMGWEIWPRLGTAVAGALLVLSVVGIWEYFHKGNFLNKGYEMPLASIAAQIKAGSPVEETVLLCDPSNSDCPALQHYLGNEPAIVPVGTAESVAKAEQVIANPRIRTIWFLHNAHDVSPGRANNALVTRLAASWRTTQHFYLLFTPLQRAIARWISVPGAPQYFHELTEFQR